MTARPTIALLGCGYTLSRVAAVLSPDEFVATASTEESAERLRRIGYAAVPLRLDDSAAVDRFFAAHPDIEIVIDSVPPLRSGEADAGVRNVVAALVSHCPKVRRILYLSTTGVYGGENGAWVTEQSAPAPAHDGARARVACERAYRSSAAPVCAVRIAAIYGPGRGIGTSLKSGSYRMVGDGSRWSNRIQVEDLAGAITAAIRSAAALPPALNAADGAPATVREIVEFYCATFGLPAPATIPLEEARRTVHPTMLSNQRVDSSLLRETLGISWRYPSYREGAATEFAAT